MELQLRGRFIEIIANLPETEVNCRYPFKISLRIGGIQVTPHQGVSGDVFGLFRDLVRLSTCLLEEGKGEDVKEDSFLLWRDIAIEAGFYNADEIPIKDVVSEKIKIYSASLMLQNCVFSFRSEVETLRIHFKCGDFNLGSVDVPIKEFVLEVLKLSMMFLQFLEWNLDHVNEHLKRKGCKWPFIITKGELLELKRDIAYLKKLLRGGYLEEVDIESTPSSGTCGGIK